MKTERAPALLALRRGLTLLLLTLLLLALVLLGVIWVMEKGPSPTLTALFCRSMRETSAIRWVPEIFLSHEEAEALKTASTEETETAPVNASLIRIAWGDPAAEEETAAEPELQLVEIAEGTVKGKLLIVRDPARVVLATSPGFGRQPGLQLTELVEQCEGVAGINAGGFNDENGRGDGGTPQGLVISRGELIWGDGSRRYHVVGFDRDHILRVGAMTGEEALAAGIWDAVSFITHDGQASELIINGVAQTQNLPSGVNPRTAIGQRADGAVLLLVLDGRSINTLGATMETVCDLMQRYGAVNAGNLDGGSSSVMVYEGRIINHCASVTGPRSIPTAFVVLGEGAEHEE